MIVIATYLAAVHWFNNGYVGKQPVAWKEYCMEYWLKELRESMDSCTGRHDIDEIITLYNRSVNQSEIASLRKNRSKCILVDPVLILSVMHGE